MRAKSNSGILADRFFEGAKYAGHEVEVISLKDETFVPETLSFIQVIRWWCFMVPIAGLIQSLGI